MSLTTKPRSGSIKSRKRIRRSNPQSDILALKACSQFLHKDFSGSSWLTTPKTPLQHHNLTVESTESKGSYWTTTCLTGLDVLHKQRGTSLFSHGLLTISSFSTEFQSPSVTGNWKGIRDAFDIEESGDVRQRPMISGRCKDNGRRWPTLDAQALLDAIPVRWNLLGVSWRRNNRHNPSSTSSDWFLQRGEELKADSSTEALE